MLERFYLDTAIWKDYYENRTDRFRPLGEWALQAINMLVERGSTILYSDLVVKELMLEYTEIGVNDILEIVSKRGLLLKVDISEGQRKDAARLCKERSVSFGDALHSILARDNSAIVITRDRHFLELQDIVITRKPEDLI